jgi:hypothetical protein
MRFQVPFRSFELHVFENRHGQTCVRIDHRQPLVLQPEARDRFYGFLNQLAHDNHEGRFLRFLRQIQASTPRGMSISRLPEEVQEKARKLLAQWRETFAEAPALEEFSCFHCTNDAETACPYAFDPYNTNGDCLAVK